MSSQPNSPRREQQPPPGSIPLRDLPSPDDPSHVTASQVDGHGEASIASTQPYPPQQYPPQQYSSQQYPPQQYPSQQYPLPPQQQQQQQQQQQGPAEWQSSNRGGLQVPPAAMESDLSGHSTYWGQPYASYRDDGGTSPSSPIDHIALQFALPPDVQSPPLPGDPDPGPYRSDAYRSDTPYGPPTPYYDEGRDTDSFESDRAPLKPAAQPMSGLEPPEDESHRRDSFQTVSDIDNSPSRSRSTRMLGFDLEPGFGSDRHRSYGNSLAPGDRRSRSPSATGALSRAGTIMRAMSQRVVMISGEGDLIDQQNRRSRSRSPSNDDPHQRHHLSANFAAEDTAYASQTIPHRAPSEKKQPQQQQQPPPPGYSSPQEPLPSSMSLPPPPPPAPFPQRLPPRKRSRPNPLKGNSLGVFSPENPLRRWLCNVLVSPWTEPLILCLIILQTVLLAVEAAPDVFGEGNARPSRWGSTRIDWAIFSLFVVFTIELIARIIVSGFVVNADEYLPPDHQRRGLRQKVAEQYQQIFRPQRQKSVRRGLAGGAAEERPDEFASTFARSFTIMQGQALPETLEEQQRLHLARRAFLRHGFNRLDFVAVVSFWISFLLGVTGLEKAHHLFLFRMLSCLRILRLLALTRGNAIILRSLKKAAPLLVRVSFLIGFFWLIFSIIGLHSFKSSLSRQCLWRDPLDPDNITAAYSPPMSFCGGHLDNLTGEARPWVAAEIPGTLVNLSDGTANPKGFLCPRGSVCLQQGNPYNGTVNFDNIVHSVELVFVIMSANTFSDLMYYTTDSDYLPAALFFVAGIMIMMLWMTNLMIAVITSSFQVIREESKASAFTADEDPVMLPDAPGSAGGPGAPGGGLRRPSTLQYVYDKTSRFWIIIIVFGLLCQSLRSATMSTFRERFIDTAEIVVTIVLDLEIAFRIVANPRGFWRKPANLVDAGLALVTSVILLPPIRHSGQVYAWLTVFQILRSYRIVLAIPMTRKLILLVLGNVTGIGNLVLFVFLITFLMAIFAAQLFRGEIPAEDDDGEPINIPFNTIFNSFLGMYQILSSENWTDLLYNVTSYTTSLQTAWYGAIFLIGWFILAFFLLINMFIAVIQENFDVGEDMKRLEQVRAFLQRKELGSSSSNLALSKVFAFGRSRKKDPLDYGPAAMEMLLKEAVVKEFLDDPLDPLQESPDGSDNNNRRDSHRPDSPGSHSPDSPFQNHRQQTDAGGLGSGFGTVRPGALSYIWGGLVSMFRRSGGSGGSGNGNEKKTREVNPFYSNTRLDGPTNDSLDPRQMARQAVTATSARRKAQREYLARHPTYNNSLFIFAPKHPLRRLCQRLVGPGRGSERFDGVEPNKYAWYTFSAIVYAAIVAMVILACVTTPLYQKEYFMTHEFSVLNWFVWTDLAFAVVFTIEALIKIIADGFFWTPNAYFRSSWGIIDGVVLITLWINIVTLLASAGAVSRAVGAFKALRALRLLNVSDSARQTFHSLIIVAGLKILSAAFVSISLLVPFAIYGVNLFSGMMTACNDDDAGAASGGALADCFGEYNSTPFRSDWELLSPRVASNPFYDFDDFGSAIFILYQIISQEGWVDVSFSAQSITARGLQPSFGASQGNALFFVVFNLLATVFVLTLFISVFMRTYTEQTGVAFLTTEQRSWLELRKLLRQISPSRSSYSDSTGRWKKWCHKRAIEKRGTWYLAITAILVFHLVLLLCEVYPEPVWWTRTRDIIFLLFILVYIANIAVRIAGLGWARFRRSSWDVYSLVAVSGAFATSILFLTNPGLDTYIQLHKFSLVAIALLLIPRNDALDQLFKTAAASLTTIGNLVATWAVFFLVFAIALTQTFSLTRFGGQEGNNVNMRTVPKALVLLFRMSCGEGWNEIMEDYATIVPPLCVESTEFFDSDCGSSAWARVLFTAWNIISMYIFVNLFVSLIYESFSYVYQRTSALAVVDRDEIRRFKEAWRSVDPAGTGFISKDAFPRLLGELSGVFEMRIYDADDSVGHILDDVRRDDQPPPLSRAGDRNRHASVASASTAQFATTTGPYATVDLDKLNRRLARIDVAKVRERRRRFNIFFEEVMVAADPDNGISFTTVLMILAHYNIISDSKSLRLEEFLRRRARLQRVEEEVRRRIVLGFFDTLYWSRQFKRHMELKRSARMATIPQLGVPEILVDNEEERGARNLSNRKTTTAATSTPTPSSAGLSLSPSTPTFLSAGDAAAAASSHRSWSGVSADLSSYDPSYRHPLSGPLSPTGSLGGGNSSPRRDGHTSAFSFELQDPGENNGTGGGGGGSARSSRRGSTVNPAHVREMLDDSVWMDSIRRSATIRRSDWGGGGGGGSGG